MEEIFLAIFHEDNLWYRASCMTEESDKGEFTVIFTDYGNLGQVHKSQMRPLPESLKLPVYMNLAQVEKGENAKDIIYKQLASGTEVMPKTVTYSDEIYSLTFWINMTIFFTIFSNFYIYIVSYVFFDKREKFIIMLTVKQMKV